MGGKSIEPLYTLKVAAELVPMPSIPALDQFLNRNKPEFPARYRRTRWYEERLLTESEILKIRAMLVYDQSDARFVHRNVGRKPGSGVSRPIKNSAVTAIMRRALAAS